MKTPNAMNDHETIQIPVEGDLLEALTRYQMATIKFKSTVDQDEREKLRTEAYNRAAELAHCFSMQYAAMLQE